MQISLSQTKKSRDNGSNPFRAINIIQYLYLLNLHFKYMEQQKKKPCNCLKGKEADARIAHWRQILSEVSKDIDDI